MTKSYIADNVMSSIILLAFFSLDNDIKAGGCCGNKIKKINPKLDKVKVINDKEIKWSKKFEDNNIDFNSISVEELYNNLGIEYFKNIDTEDGKKSENIKKYINQIKELIIKNIKSTLVFKENIKENKEKNKNRIFSIVIDGYECGDKNEENNKDILGLKQYLDEEIKNFYKNKGYKDYFLLAYLLFKINKNIYNLKNNETRKSLSEFIEDLNYKKIISERETIDKFIYNKNNREFILDFNDIDLSMATLNIFNRIKYCFLVYIILITNEFFDKFPFFVKNKKETKGNDALKEVCDNVTVSYLLKNLLKNERNITLDIYEKIAETKFNNIKTIYEKLQNITIPIFAEDSRLILSYDETYFKDKKFFTDENKDNIEEKIKESCCDYSNFYEYMRNNSTKLSSYIKKIFEYKIKGHDKKGTPIYKILNDYENSKEKFNNNNLVLKMTNFTKIKIKELSEAYDKLYN